MKIILTIGYRRFLLPATANFNQLVQTLSKAQLVEHERVGNRYVYVIDENKKEDGHEAAKIEMVEDRDVITRPKRKLKSIAETASPDAHNTF